jgi:pilus assembly protein CpaF
MSGDLLERVRHRLAAGSGSDDLGQLAGQESALLLDSHGRSELSGQLAAELTGAGPLEELLATAGVTDVLVNAPDQVWLDRGAGLERTRVRFDSDAAVRRLATRLAAQAGRRLDDAAPFVDAVLPDGSRLHAILPPLVAHPTLSLRVLARRSLSLPELVALGAMPGELADLLAALVQARLTLLISGGTGSGKTTLLAALLATVSPAERIITIEDTAELAVSHPHVVALLARSANVEGAGAVELRELVRQALRMRADRLVVGEFRGAEIVELLAALNTGHAGGAATVHANSVGDVAARLVALAALGGMPAQALAAQAASALDVLVHIRRDRDGRRRVEQVALWPAGPSPAGLPGLAWTRAAGLGPAAGQLRALLEAAEVGVPALLAEVDSCRC